MGTQVNLDQLSAARTHAENAKNLARQLEGVMAYMRNGHIGMVHGNGELTRYLSYLSRNIHQEATKAETTLKDAGVPEELPF